MVIYSKMIILAGRLIVGNNFEGRRYPNEYKRYFHTLGRSQLSGVGCKSGNRVSCSFSATRLQRGTMLRFMRMSYIN